MAARKRRVNSPRHPVFLRGGAPCRRVVVGPGSGTPRARQALAPVQRQQGRGTPMHLHADFLLPDQALEMQAVSFTEWRMNFAQGFILPTLRQAHNQTLIAVY